MIRYYNGDYGFPAGNPAGMQNAYQVAGSPSFEIPGGASPNRFPSAPGEPEFLTPKQPVKRPDQQLFPVPSPRRTLPLAMGGFQGDVSIGNMGGLVAQAQTASIPGAKYTLKQLIGDRPGGMSDIPGDTRFRGDTQLLPYVPGNDAQNNKQNPLRGNRWTGPFDPRGYVGPGISPYFGNRQGPGLYGEMGTGAI